MEDEKNALTRRIIDVQETQVLTSSEILTTALDLLAAERGIKESDEMKALRREAISATADQIAFSTAISKYQDLCREGTDNTNPESVMEGITAEMLLLASIRIAALRIEERDDADSAVNTLEDAASYAHEIGDDSLTDALEQMIEQLKK